MKVIKFALYVVLGLVLIILALPLWIGPVAKVAVNGVVPGILGTDFKVEKLAFNPYSGRIFVGGLNVSNPQGFDEPTAVRVESVAVSFSTTSLLARKIHIYDITIENPFVSYVNDATGSNNFARIAANLKGDAAKEEPAAEAPAQEPEVKDSGKKMRYQIDRLSIDGLSVKVLMLPALPVPVPTLTDIGSGEEGATAEEVRDSVWASIRGTLNSAGGMIGAGMQSSGEQAKKAAENVKEGAKKTIESLGNLFKGK